MIDRADIFVFLDSVQFARRSWQQRNRIKTANGPLMLTVPVHKKGARDQTIAEVRIDEQAQFPLTQMRAIEHALTKAPYFATPAEALFGILGGGRSGLSDLNIAQNGRACCRERACAYVWRSVGRGQFRKHIYENRAK